MKSDSGQIWECDCAMIDVLYELKPARCKGIALFRVFLPMYELCAHLNISVTDVRTSVHSSHRCAEFVISVHKEYD